MWRRVAVTTGCLTLTHGTSRVTRGSTLGRTRWWHTRRVSGGEGSGSAVRNGSRTDTRARSWATTVDASRQLSRQCAAGVVCWSTRQTPPHGTHGLMAPPRSGGWVVADFCGGWTCAVAQGNYAHRGNKWTWLYANGVGLPSLIWGVSDKRVLLAGLSKARRERDRRTGIVQALSKKQRTATPLPFRDLLLSMARSVRRDGAHAREDALR